MKSKMLFPDRKCSEKFCLIWPKYVSQNEILQILFMDFSAVANMRIVLDFPFTSVAKYPRSPQVANISSK